MARARCRKIVEMFRTLTRGLPPHGGMETSCCAVRWLEMSARFWIGTWLEHASFTMTGRNMRIQALQAAAFRVGALVAMASPGCSSGNESQVATDAGTTSSSGGGTGGTGTGGTGTGGTGTGGTGTGGTGTGGTGAGTGTGGTGAGTGTGGTGGGTMADKGRSATETVTAGEVGTSPSYKMLFTFGQPTQNQGKTTSPSYGLQGGIVGANGSVK
jgi:hypothetical protein